MSELVTDAEVLQEILHRYVAIDRREGVIAMPTARLSGRSSRRPRAALFR